MVDSFISINFLCYYALLFFANSRTTTTYHLHLNIALIKVSIFTLFWTFGTYLAIKNVTSYAKMR